MLHRAQRETGDHTAGNVFTSSINTDGIDPSSAIPQRRLKQTLLAAWAVLLSGLATKAAVITVGSGPLDQYSRIQSAIDAASPGDEITVAAGTYRGPGNRDIEFRGKALVLRSLAGPEVTVIDCENNGRGFYLHENEDRDTVIEGFTIRAGSGSPGAAIRLEPGSPTVRNCIITGNTGFSAVSLWESEPLVDGCVISQNGGDGISAWDGCTIRSCSIENNQGRGISHAAGQIIDCTIRGNAADASRGDNFGGGLHGYQGRELILSGCTIAENTSKSSGSGAYVEDINRVVVTNCVFLKNGPTGALATRYSQNPPLVQFCDFVENSGNGVFSSQLVRIQNCRFLRNQGSGLFTSSNAVVSNSLFQGNQAAEGGACASYQNSSSELILINCTLTGNSAEVQGGALYIPGSSSKARLFGCILWGNSAPAGAEISLRFSTLFSEFSDIAGGQASINNYSGTVDWGEGNRNVDPLFLSGDNFRLAGNSPCIDTAGTSIPVEPVLTELDHKPRAQDGNGDGMYAPDMGAYEYGDELAEIRPVALVVYGPRQVLEGRTAQFTATAFYDDGTARDVASQVIWSVVAPAFATIDANGLLHAMLVTPDRSQTVTATLYDAAVTLTASRDILIRDSGYIEIVTPKSVGERSCAPLTAIAHKSDGTPMGDITAQTTWSVSPGLAGQVGIGGVFRARSVDADAVEKITAWAMVEGAFQSSSKDITVLNTALEGSGVLLDDGFGDRDTFNGAEPGGLTIGPDGLGTFVYALHRFPGGGQVLAELNVQRQLPGGCWALSTLENFAFYPGQGGTTIERIVGPVVVAGEPGFLLETSSSGIRTVAYYYLHGSNWLKEVVTQGTWGPYLKRQTSLALDQQGKPCLLRWAALGDGKLTARRYVREMGDWIETVLDRPDPAGQDWNLALDDNGQVWCLRGPVGGPHSVLCLTDPAIPERPYASADGQTLNIRGVMGVDHEQRVYQAFADTQGPISVIRPLGDRFLREPVDSFGWGHDGSQRILFDAANRPVLLYGVSAVGSCGEGCRQALWGELRAAVLDNGTWNARRIDGTSQSSTTILTCQPDFDDDGNLHVGILHLTQPDGVYYGFLPAGSSLLTGGDFNEPTNLVLDFDLVNPSPDNNASIVTLPGGNPALRLHSGSGEPFGIAQDTQPSTVFTVSCRYRFSSPARIILKLGGETLDLLSSPSGGPGAPGSGTWGRYHKDFNLQELNLNPKPPFAFEILLAGSTSPDLLLDDLKIMAGVTSGPDFDSDGDVDGNDWLVFSGCTLGPGLPVETGCSAEDLDRDGDVDQTDFAIFQRCFSGPDVPADPQCEK